MLLKPLARILSMFVSSNVPFVVSSVDTPCDSAYFTIWNNSGFSSGSPHPCRATCLKLDESSTFLKSFKESEAVVSFKFGRIHILQFRLHLRVGSICKVVCGNNQFILYILPQTHTDGHRQFTGRPCPVNDPRTPGYVLSIFCNVWLHSTAVLHYKKVAI